MMTTVGALVLGAAIGLGLEYLYRRLRARARGKS